MTLFYKYFKPAEVLFLVTLFVILVSNNQLYISILISLLVLINIYVICHYINIDPIKLSIIYIIVSPFRRFISIHQPFYFPTALPLELIILVLFIISITHFRKHYLHDLVILLFICYYIWGFIEIFNPLGSIAIGMLGFRNRTMSSVFFLISFLSVKSFKDVSKLFDAMLTILIFVAFYGIFHFFFPTSAELTIYQQNIHQSNYFMSADSDMRRAFSTLTSPGAFGVAMFLLFSMLIYKLADSPSYYKPRFYFFLIMNIIALLVSGSRSSLIAASLFLYLYLISKCNFKDKIKYSVISLLSTTSILYVLLNFGPSDISARLMGIFEPLEKGASFATRLGLWDVLYKSITKMPFGFGNGATGIEIGLDNNTIQLPNVITILTDNEYITLLYEQGWVGCFLFLTVSLSLIYKVYNSITEFTQHKYNSYLSFIAILSIVYLILGVPIQLSQIYPINVFIWILWGSSYAIIKQENQ